MMNIGSDMPYVLQEKMHHVRSGLLFLYIYKERPPFSTYKRYEIATFYEYEVIWGVPSVNKKVSSTFLTCGKGECIKVLEGRKVAL